MSRQSAETQKFTTRFAGGTEVSRGEKTEMHEINSNLRFRIISRMALFERKRGEKLCLHSQIEHRWNGRQSKTGVRSSDLIFSVSPCL